MPLSSAIAQVLKLLARVEVVWWLTRSTQLDDFRIWAQQVCTDPWQKETVLCQAVEGNWLARQLVRAKLHEAEADHCDPAEVRGGCRHDPCTIATPPTLLPASSPPRPDGPQLFASLVYAAGLSKGLSRVLLGVADNWGSPLNNRLSGVYYALLPVRQRLRNVLRGMAKGKVGVACAF